MTYLLLPRVLGRFFAGDVSTTAGAFGLFMMIVCTIQLFLSIVAGVLSDAKGRRPMLVTACFVTAATYALLPFATSLVSFFGLGALAAIGGSALVVGTAYVADVTPPESRAARFGLLSASWSVSMLCGPAVGGLLSELGWKIPFVVAAGLMATCGLVALGFLRESLARSRRRPFAWRRASPFGPLRLLRAQRALVPFALVYALTFFVEQGHSIGVLYMQAQYGWSAARIGFAMMFAAVCNFGVQSLLVGPVVRRAGERRVLLAALALGAVGFATLGLASTGGLYLLGLFVLALYSPCHVTLDATMLRCVDRTEFGELQGMTSALRGTSSIVGVGVFASVYAVGVGHDAPGLSYLFGATLLLVALAIGAAKVRSPA
jgi:DHA1 family tetracycline resistance protein-like MFS transporter